MKMKFLLLFIAIILICIGIYFFANQATVNEAIEHSVTEMQDTETLTINNTEQDEDEMEPEDKDEQVDDEQEKNKITTVFKKTVNSLFKKEFHIVAVGDSLTQGIGDDTNNGGYIGILDDQINHTDDIITFENFGKRGNRTDQLLKRLEEQEISDAIEDTDIVLMTIGANDIMQVAKENFTNLTYPLFVEEQVAFEERLHHIFEKIQSINPNTHIYLIGLYNPFEKYFQDIEELDLIVNSWNQTSMDTVEAYENATFIPVKDLFDETDINLFAEDNFHPNLNGYQRIAKRVLTYLTDTVER